MKTKRFAFCTSSEKETKAAGAALAAVAEGIICLNGDLGAGKTVLTKGIARELGITGYITSPTFNIVNTYSTEKIVFNHMDAYRLTDLNMLYDIGFDEIIESGDITVIEWSDLIAESLGDVSVSVRMQRGSSDNKRIIIFEADTDIIDELIRSLQ